jgi:hypothetical protein
MTLSSNIASSDPAAAKQATENLTTKAFSRTGIQLEEARMVLNIKDIKEGIDPKEVSEVGLSCFPRFIRVIGCLCWCGNSLLNFCSLRCVQLRNQLSTPDLFDLLIALSSQS